MKFIEEEILEIQEKTNDPEKRAYLYSELLNINIDTLSTYDLSFMFETILNNAEECLK